MGIPPAIFRPIMAVMIQGVLTACGAGKPTPTSLDAHSPGPPQVIDVTRPGAAYAAKVVHLDTRPGVRQGLLLLAPEKPVASAILFAGGSGRIGLKRDGEVASSNFLVRSRALFARRGIAVAVVDVPSDIRSLKPVEVRFGEPHRRDMEAVIAYLRRTLERPVWLVGTSRGTLSAAAVAANGRVPVDGLVLTSSMREVTELDLRGVSARAMVVANRNDVCRVTPPDFARNIARALRTKAVYFESAARSGRACGALSPHGFLGIEEQVVSAIVRFMREE